MITTARPIVTVTLNPAIDQTLSIHGFAAGRVNRVAAEHINAGGKGVNVAAVLADMGVPVIVTGLLGDKNAAVFEQLFHRKRIDDRFIRVVGRTRMGIKIVDEPTRETTDINFPGLTPTASSVDELIERIETLVEPGRWFVLSGSVPAGVSPDIYATLVERVHRRGGKTIVDTSGVSLRAALAMSPEVVKPNVAELAELAGGALESHDQIVEAARALLIDRGVELAVVSMGGEGALFVSSGRVVLARPPAVEVKSTVGAGDAMVAGLVFGRHHELPLEETARLATALAAHAVTRIGAGLDTPKAYEAWMPGVGIESMTPQPA